MYNIIFCYYVNRVFYYLNFFIRHTIYTGMGSALGKVVDTTTAPVAVGTNAAATIFNKSLDVAGNTVDKGLNAVGNLSQNLAKTANELVSDTFGVGQSALQGTGDVLNTTANVAVDATGKIIELPKSIVNTFTGGSVQGGDEDDLVPVNSVLGGYEDLQKYGDSIYSRSKERLIRDIAYDVFSLLKLPKADRARKAPIEEVVKHLQTVVPNPRKGKHFNDSFNSSAGKQSKMCRALANAINKNYGGQIIPSDLSEHDTCVKVAEVMTSLFTGLHTEFMGVAGDVLRIVRNLETLKQVIDASYKRQVELTNASGDSQLKLQAASVKDFYERVKSELERQLAILTNLVNVAVGPTTKSLIGLLEENRDFSGMVRDLKVDLGTNAFGDKLAYLLSGVSSIAHSAEIIDKALKTLGMSVGEFRSAKGISDLRLKVLDHIERASPTSKELDKMMAAAEIIYKNDYNHKKISELLGKKGRGEASGGDCGCDGGDDVEVEDDILDSSNLNMPPYAFPVGGKKSKKNKYSESENKDSNIGNMYHGGSDSDDDDVTTGGNIVGGVDEDDGLTAYWSRKSLSNKIKKKEKYRDLLLKDFRKLLRIHYRNIVEAADSIAKQIAKEIPVTDDLYRFVDVFSSMPSIDSENLHIALSGYPKDSVSRQERDNFMNKYHLLLVTLEPLMKGPGGVYFKDIYNAAANLVKAIDNFSDKMVRAITEIHVDRPEDIRDALKKTATSFFGSGASGAGGEDLFGSGSFVEFRKVQMEMRYYLSIYNIKTNLGRAAEEMKDFGEDYEQILGEEAGWLINQIKREYLALIDDANPYPEPNRPAIIAAPNVGVAAVAAGAVGNVGTLIRAHPAVAAVVPRAGETPATAQERAAKNMFENLRELFTRQMNAKVRMVEVAQAIDLYLRSFADGIARDPDSVKSVIKMLDQVEIVAKWFTDRSGNQLASIFEFFPNNANGINFSSGNNAAGANAVVNAQDEQEAKINLPMEAENKDHYYAWLNTPAPGVGMPIVPLPPSKGPGVPTLGRPLDVAKNRVKGLLTLTDKTIKSMRALENILSAFATVGSKFGDVEPISKTFMTPGQIFNSLCEYINVSSYTTNFNIDGANTAQIKTPYTEEFVTDPYGGLRLVPNPLTIPGARNNPGVTYADGSPAVGPLPALAGARSNFGILSGVANVAPRDRKLSLAMSSIPNNASNGDAEFWNYHDPANRDRMRNDFAGWLDRFYDTDLLFIMTIKSVVCKIFTVVDAYRLFNRPLSEKNIDQFNSLAPLRTILGGANHVKVLPEALELYLRLPLLAEWYRDKFNFSSGVPAGIPPLAPTPNDWRLAMVPTIDGVWSKFIGLIFDKADYVVDGNYSETQIQKMIVEINDIYRHYKTKYPKSTVRNIINSFVVEINRAFGFIKQTEIEAYRNERRKYLDPDAKYDNGDDPNFNQYDILNAEDQFGRNPAPSDKFVTVAERQKQRRDRNMVHMQKYIIELRKRVDADFRSYTHEAKNGNQPVVSFVDTLRNYKKELENAKNDKESYETVLHIIQGTSNLTNVNPDKLLMLHESVAAPLAALFNVYKVLARYNALLHGTSAINLTAWGQVPAPGNIGQIQPIGVAKDPQLNLDYETVLRTKYLGDSVNRYRNCQMFANAMLGVFHSVDVNDRRGYLTSAAAVNTAYVAPNNAILGNLDNESVARDIISALLDLTTNPNGMIRCSISDSGLINVDWSALEELCANLLQQVKNNVNQLRIEFTSGDFKDMVNKYTQKDYIGSVNWLEEHLFEQLFKDRDRTGLATAHTVHLKSTIEYLTLPAGGANGRVLSLENVFAQLVYYNHRRQSLVSDATVNNLTKFPFNVLSLTVEPESQTLEQKTALSYLRNGVIPLGAAAAGAAAPVPADVINTLNNIVKVPSILFSGSNSLNEWNLRVFDNRNEHMKSLMLTLNRAIHKYLNDNFDDGTQKIYPGLFESFMNSVASDEVIQNKSFPNIGVLQPGAPIAAPIAGQAIVGVASPNTPLWSPAEGSILFESTAQIMQSIMSNMDKLLKKRRHTYDTLAEVPEYLRERMKCNLPIYSKLFQMIFARADMLRRLLNNTAFKTKLAVLDALPGGLVLPAGTNVNNVGILPVALVDLPANVLKRGASNLRNVTGDWQQNHKYLDVQLAHICDLTLAIKKCCDGVYKELQDVSPYFMDLSKDFITDYKARYGAMPFMPASMILLPQLAFNGSYNLLYNGWMSQPLRNLLLPSKLNGSASYKFNLASRVLLARSDVEPQLDHMPGAKELYNNYASVAQKHSMVSANDYANTMKLLVYISRFLNDGAVYSRLFDNKSMQYNIASRGDRYPTNSVYGAMYSVGNEICLDLSNSPALAVREDPLNKAMQEFFPDYNTPPIRNLTVLPYRIELNDAANMTAALPHVEPLCVPMQTLSMVDALNYVENSNKKQSKTEFAKKISGVTGLGLAGVSRDALKVYNILDMGIVPINVHAFMKEVPFTNLLNYSYTFDRMVHDFIAPNYLNDQPLAPVPPPPHGITPANLMIPSLYECKSTREMYVKLLVHPYSSLGATPAEIGRQYYGLIGSLFNGNDNLKLGRPRYLSDQLWHKVLLTSSAQYTTVGPGAVVAPGVAGARPPALVYTGYQAMEAGPQAYEAQRWLENIQQPAHYPGVPAPHAMPNFTAGLKYWSKVAKTWVTASNIAPVAPAGAAVDIAPNNVLYLAELGNVRFNTKLVRNLTWLVNLQRAMRAILIAHLSWIDTPVVRGLKIVDPVVTEYNSNDQFDADEYNNATEYSVM